MTVPVDADGFYLTPQPLEITLRLSAHPDSDAKREQLVTAAQRFGSGPFGLLECRVGPLTREAWEFSAEATNLFMQSVSVFEAHMEQHGIRPARGPHPVSIMMPSSPQRLALEDMLFECPRITARMARQFGKDSLAGTDAYRNMQTAARAAGVDTARRRWADLIISQCVESRPKQAIRSAAWALACRHLIGDVFRQQDYDVLTAPWAAVMGRAHSDDQTKEVAA